MPNRGIFIVLEGADGSGKGTQFNLLAERLKAIGYNIAIFDFPRYDKGSSHFVKEYLNGRYGSASEISPYTASLFFALDRYEASKDIKKALDEGKIVLSNRYVGSNMAHQGGKFGDDAEQRGFFVWADNLEYQLLGIPRPDISLFLRVPAEVSYELIKRKQARSYTDKVQDEHEGDREHLKRSVATYDLLCRLFPKDFRAIECTKNGRLMSVPEINNLIWESLKPLLPTERPNPSHSAVVSLSAGEDSQPAKETGLSGELGFTFKDSSLLLKLQVVRIMPVVNESQSDSWAAAKYAFYTPGGLPHELAATYKAGFKNLADLHEVLRNRLTRYLEKTLLEKANAPGRQTLGQLLLPLTPLGALSPFSVTVRKSDVEQLCGNLLAQETDEAQWAAQQLYLAARQKWPKDFKQALESNTPPEPIHNIIAKLAADRLPRHNSDSESVKLVEARPRHEFDLLAESIYQFSHLPHDEIAEEVSNWPYQQKFESLKQAAAIPGLLDKVGYKIDLISDQITLGRLAETAQLESVQVQTLTPRYGFDVPTIIEEAGLDDLYNECFDESLKLYGQLQSAGREDLAPYAALMGHKVRWQLSTNAQKLREIFKLSSEGSISPLTAEIYEKVSEVHPLLWEIIAAEAVPAAKLRQKSKPRIKESHRRPNRNPKKS